MALKIEPNQSATAYHITSGATVFPYAVDAVHAVSSHPLEWSDTPWSQQDAAAARQRLNERNKLEGAPPVAEPLPLSPEDQKALDEHNKAVAEAAARLKDYHAKKAEEKKIADQVAADEALVASVPPQPDPNVRRPLTPAQLRKQSATLTPAEQAAKDAADRAADQPHPGIFQSGKTNEQLAADKAEADRMGIASRNTI
jgi:hypothetical protein